MRAWNSFVSALGGLDSQGHKARARDPYGNHVWVYAAIMAIATNMSQVPLMMWEESPDNPATSRRRQLRAGSGRTAIQRFLDQHGRKRGFQIRGVEPVYDHDLARVLHTPNPYETQPEFMMRTEILKHTKGACFWLKTDRNGGLVGPNETPYYLWAMNPDYFCPEWDGTTFLGWTVSLPWQDPATMGKSNLWYDLVRPYQCVLHRFPNPEDPMGWMTPLNAAASGVSMDIAAMTYNRAVLLNGAKPGGLLLHEDDIDAAEEDKLRKYWSQKHEGPQNANKLAILTGNFKYVDIGLGPKDMDYLEQRRWDRDEILGALGTPKSILSITDQMSYSSLVSNDKNFWDKKLLPEAYTIERVADKSLMQKEMDNRVLGFDLSRVEALRAGLKDSVDIVVQLTGPQVHMPPKQAFSMVGLDAPSYPGDDVCLIPGSLASSIDVIEGKVAQGTPATPGNDPATGQPDQAGDPRQPRPADQST